MRTSIVWLVVVLLSAWAQGGEGGNSSHTPGISVIGQSSIQLKPSVIQITASLSMEGEMANDARVKARDAHQRFTETLAMKWPSVSIESKGVALNPVLDATALAMQQQRQVMVINGVAQLVGQNQVDLNRRMGATEQLHLILKDTDKLEFPKIVEMVSGVIDTIRECGLQFGQPITNSSIISGAQAAMPTGPLIVCKAANEGAGREQAYKAAIDDARQKATTLADLAGAKVGKIVGIRELDESSDAPRAAQIPGPVNHQESESSTPVIGEITLRVRLAVEFEMIR